MRRRSMLAALLLMGVTICSGSHASETLYPGDEWPTATPADVGLDSQKLEQAKRYALSAGGSGLIVRQGKVVMRWGDQKKCYDVKSATKSFGATMLGVAIKDGKVTLDAPARRYYAGLGVPPRSNTMTGWLDKMTLRHLATQTAGFAKPGGFEKLLFEPGTHWYYSDGGPNWLADCITLAYRRDLHDVMFERVFEPIGISRDDLRWRNNQYRPHQLEGVARREFGSGVHANVNALSRLGYLYLHKGKWKDQQILTEDFVRLATRPVKGVTGLPEWPPATHGNASDHYGLLWWNNADGSLPDVPRDAFWVWGLYDSLIVVVESLDVVVVRAGARGKQWPRRDGESHYQVLAPFLNPIVTAVTAEAQGPPCPPSTFISGVEWAPPQSIVRKASGSDNWPITWADDGHLYSAYGDGWGFAPKLEKKLSLGLVRIEGDPPNVRGFNIRSADAEKTGQGPQGQKASGMLMVDGVIYMLVRNADNARLAWSEDHAKTWEWADWKWTVSFGCPTFLNYGKNFAGASDGFVYVYSPDSDTAYQAADQMVLARVWCGGIRRRDAYEFLQRIDGNGKPVWTKSIAKRGPVFKHRGRCYRSGITYNAGLKRYLWCQTLPESKDARGPRFQGGLGVYEARRPWGPWRTIFFTNEWDVGPGETSCFPTKWISPDGKTVHLLFSGDDHFSVRRATLSIAGTK